MHSNEDPMQPHPQKKCVMAPPAVPSASSSLSSFILAVVCTWQCTHRHTGLLPSFFIHKPHNKLLSIVSPSDCELLRGLETKNGSSLGPRAQESVGAWEPFVGISKCVQTVQHLSASG